MNIHLTSHALCPYVQRASISLAEKNVEFDQTIIDLAKKPDWFLRISPLGKTPVLSVGGHPIFESAAILEFLEETQPNPLHPQQPITRAQHRGWIEFGSSVLNDIAGFYATDSTDVFSEKVNTLSAKFTRLEAELGEGPYFSGSQFSLVDAVYAPVFRYFDVFDLIDDFKILSSKPKIDQWRQALNTRPSVKRAVAPEYPELLWGFLRARGSHLSRLMAGRTYPMSHRTNMENSHD